MLDMEEIPQYRIINLEDPKDYADCLVDVIKSLENPTSDYKIIFLQILAHLYNPNLYPDISQNLLKQVTEQYTEATIRPEEFIFLVYQFWQVIKEPFGAPTQIDPMISVSELVVPSPPSATSSPTAIPAVTKHNNSLWSGLTQRASEMVGILAKEFSQNYDYNIPVVSKVDKQYSPPKSLSQELREKFNNAGRPKNYKPNDHSGYFAHMFYKAYEQYNLHALPDLQNRAVMHDIFKDLKYKSNPIQGLSEILSNIITWNPIHAEQSEPLKDSKKIALIGVLLRAIRRAKFAQRHQADKKDLIEKTKQFIATANQAFKQEKEVRLRKQLAEVREIMQKFNISHGLPIKLLTQTINNILQIANQLLNDPPLQLDSKTDQILVKDLAAVIVDDTLEFGAIEYRIDIEKLHTDYIPVGYKSFNLRDELNEIKNKLPVMSEPVLSRIQENITKLQQQLCKDNQEILGLDSLLTEQDRQIKSNEEQRVILNKECDEINAKNKVANELVQQKSTNVLFLGMTLQRNIMWNYNKKYSYKKFTIDIFDDKLDKRLPEEKLSDRWWDGKWFLGFERFCNWCAGTTRQERVDDAVAAVKLHNVIEAKNQITPILNIDDKRIEWLLQDISKADPDYKDGKARKEEYDKKAYEYNQAQEANNNEEASQRIQRLIAIQSALSQLLQSDSMLKPKQSQNAKQQDELNQRMRENKAKLNTIKKTLQNEFNLIGERILLLNDEAQKETSKLLSSLKSKIEVIITDIDKPLQNLPAAQANVTDSDIRNSYAHRI